MASFEDDSKPKTNMQELKDFISNHDLSSAINKIQEYLKQQDLVELNIGVTGETGSGKSTFVNALMGLDENDERSAKTGVVETTMKPEVYLHPKHKNVKVWDLPGIGTKNFKANEYFKKVGFESLDLFIIIASDRFKECHTELAKEIVRMGKRFYFVRTKIDSSIDAEKRKKGFDLEKTLNIIRKDCEKGLREIGMTDPVVFLISGWKFGKYDFNRLQNTIEEELPQQRRLLILALPNITCQMNEKKKKAFEEKNLKVALLAAFVAAIPVPGLSFAVDTAIIATELKKYYSAFDLDDPSLQLLSERSGKTVEELKSLMKSPLRHGINQKTIFILLQQSFMSMSLNAFGRFVSFIPIIGSVAAAGIYTVSRMLQSALNDIAEDANCVLTVLLQD